MLLTATKRIVGRVTASQIASAFGGIGFASLDVGLHVGRRHQANRLAELVQFTAPMMSCRTRLDADEAGVKASEEFQHLATAQWLTNDYLAASVDAVNLENIFGKVESDCNNLIHGMAPFPCLSQQRC